MCSRRQESAANPRRSGSTGLSKCALMIAPLPNKRLHNDGPVRGRGGKPIRLLPEKLSL